MALVFQLYGLAYLYMRRHTKILLALVSCFFLSCETGADLQSTIQYIESLLKNGKVVSILCIDMQEYFSRYFLTQERARNIIAQQIKLFEYFSDQPNIFFTDINVKNRGQTILDLRSALVKSSNYGLFFKKKRDAFILPPATEGDKEGNVITTSLDTYLRSKGVTDVFLTGCYDGECILQTAIGATRLKYNVAVDRDLTIYSRPQNEADTPHEDWDEAIRYMPSIHIIQNETTCSP